MASYRPESVGRNIQQQLSEILRTETRDPRLMSITLTGVKMSQDLRTARIYFSILGDETSSSDNNKGRFHPSATRSFHSRTWYWEAGSSVCSEAGIEML